MTAVLFPLTFAVAAPFWALMILLPRWSWTRRIVTSPLIVLPVVVIYALLVLPALATVLPEVADPDLEGIRAFLGTADGAAAAWAHMIAFDLFVGRWAWLDGTDRGIPIWLMSPLLVLTILLGPLGLGAYLLVRTRYRAALQRTSPDPAPVGPTSKEHA
ncbi:ABA4-like family protein [Actinoplanes sp. NPDC051859]|uniref:ABA4-like family protein n=1 Tax=Actinoplanes sp. NPDC051859 TaxID=3363909 RepID=UPI00378799FF